MFFFHGVINKVFYFELVVDLLGFTFSDNVKLPIALTLV
jgi:hypothetical protein